MPSRRNIHRFAYSLLAGVLAAISATAHAALEISEFMADNNDTLQFADGTTPDWIEIHNPDATPIDLAGWHLTDDALEPDKWTFPAGATIAAGDYLVVYASGLGTVGAGGEYHTNFSLDDQGEYLALVRPDDTVVQEFSPTYPKQYSDVSYGLPPGVAVYGYFTDPTPDEANNNSVQGFVKDTTFSHKRGFYDAAFQLQVRTETPGATIYYTTDGSAPNAASAHADAPDANTPPILPLNITTTTIVRVYAAKTGFVSTTPETQTYIFLDDVIANPEMSTSITGHATWGPKMRAALLEIPSISLVTQGAIPDQKETQDLLPGEDPFMHGPEVHVSIEMIFPDGRDGFQANAAVERFGGQYTLFPKQSLRVSFKKELVNTVYDDGAGKHIEIREPIDGPNRLKFDLFGDTPYGGNTAVDSFDQILLRSGSHDSLFSDYYPFSLGTYIRDRYCFDRQIEAGHLSMRGKFVHVYHNGSYRGQYQLMERPTADFMATHQGGEEEDYDIMKGRGGIFALQGDDVAWNHLVSNTSNYAIVQDYMDVDNYIDYMLLNFYGGNDHDWYPFHNWAAGRKREPGGKFQFFMWDNDFLFCNGGSPTTASTSDTLENGGPGDMFNNLRNHLEFKVRMGDRAQKHFFNGGMLSEERVKADFTKLAQSISTTLIPETARWAGEIAPRIYTMDSFHSYVDWIVNVNAETRGDIVINQMRSYGVFPNVDAPFFSQHGGFVEPTTPVTMATDANRIYYTLDGSDPRLPGGAVNSSAQQATLVGGGATPQTFIDSGKVWKYLDNGSNQGTAWKEVGFSDGSWKSGPSELGYGDNGEGSGTQVNSGPAGAFYLTTYFRTTVNIPNPDTFSGFLLRLKYDDGAAVYVNGTEVIRPNLAAGAKFDDPASSWVPDESSWKDFTLPTSRFAAGINTIAVEVHQNSPTSSDMRMDMILIGQVSGGGSNISTPLYFSAPTLLRARSYASSTGEWSALNEASFLLGVPASSDNLVISKIHYHPSDAQGDLAEFVELLNISDQPVNLAGVTFSEGIFFAFDDIDTLQPGQRAVLVADPTAFQAAYDASPSILGTFTSRLANDGERVTLSDPDGLPLQTLRYNDKAPWPTEADGAGYCLVLIAPESAPDHELAQNWRASVVHGGSPGTADSIPFTGNTATDLLGYALGDPRAIGIRFIGATPVLEFPRALGADDATVTVELSSDLVTWHAGEAVLLDQSARVGSMSIQRWGLPDDGSDRRFARLRTEHSTSK